MYCDNCGTKLTGDENYCFNCGKKVNNVNNSDVGKANISTVDNSNNLNTGTKTASIVLGIISLVGIFLVIFSPISLILSLVGLILSIKANKVTNNVAGIVINAIGLFLSLIITSIIVFILYLVVNMGNNIDLSKMPWNEYISEYEERF